MTWEAPVQMVQTWSIEVTSNPQKEIENAAIDHFRMVAMTYSIY
jgi:hypothetical protein